MIMGGPLMCFIAVRYLLLLMTSSDAILEESGVGVTVSGVTWCYMCQLVLHVTWLKT